MTLLLQQEKTKFPADPFSELSLPEHPCPAGTPQGQQPAFPCTDSPATNTGTSPLCIPGRLPAVFHAICTPALPVPLKGLSCLSRTIHASVPCHRLLSPPHPPGCHTLGPGLPPCPAPSCTSGLPWLRDSPLCCAPIPLRCHLPSHSSPQQCLSPQSPHRSPPPALSSAPCAWELPPSAHSSVAINGCSTEQGQPCPSSLPPHMSVVPPGCPAALGSVTSPCPCQNSWATVLLSSRHPSTPVPHPLPSRHCVWLLPCLPLLCLRSHLLT